MPNRVAYSFVARDKFTSATKKIGRETDKIRKKIKRLGPAATAASIRVRGAFAAIKAAAVSTMRTGIAPLLAAFASLAAFFKFFKLGTGFEDSIADLRAITGATGKDLAFLKEEAMRLGVVSKTASGEVVGAFKLVASAKSELLKDPKALSQITEQVLLLKNASGIELAEAANIALESMNQFGVGADQAARFVNVLAAGAKIGASEVFDTGSAIVEAGVASTLTGVNFEELNSAIQVMAKGGLKGRRAGTGLQGMLLKLDKALPKGIKGAGGLSNALDVLANANLGNTELMKLFGLESIKAAGILLNSRSLVRQWTGELTGTNVAQEQAAIRLGTLSAKIRGVGVSLQNFLIRAFDRLAPGFDELAEKARVFFENLKPEDVDRFAGRLKTIFRILAPIGKLLLGLLKIVNFVATPVIFILDILASKIESLVKILGAAADLPALAGGAFQAIKGKVMGIFGGEELDVTGAASVTQSAKMESTVTLKAPKGIVESVKTKTSGAAAGLKMGVNMVEELP